MTDLSLTDLLRMDSENYGRYRRGELDPGETTAWDQNHERAWQAADEIDALAHVIEQAPHGQGCASWPNALKTRRSDGLPGYWEVACDCWKSAAPAVSLAEHDAEVKAQALDEAARAYPDTAGELWMSARAVAIREEI